MKIIIIAAVLVSLLAVCNSQTADDISCVVATVDNDLDLTAAFYQNCPDFDYEVRSQFILRCLSGINHYNTLAGSCKLCARALQ